MVRFRFALIALSFPVVAAFAQAGADRQTPGAPAPTPQADPADQPMDIVVVGRQRGPDGPSPKVPPRCVQRSGDPADLIRVSATRTSQRVIAPDRNGVLRLQEDREQISGPTWQRAGTGLGQYVFRVPEDGGLMCIGATRKNPNGWGQLRQIIRTTKDMRGRYVHFSTLIAARNARLIRFWLAIGASGARVKGGDTNQTPLEGTFGWRQADVIFGPIPYEASHISFGFLLWGKGDVWVLDPHIDIKTRAEVQGIPALPISSRRPLGEQKGDPF